MKTVTAKVISKLTVFLFHIRTVAPPPPPPPPQTSTDVPLGFREHFWGQFHDPLWVMVFLLKSVQDKQSVVKPLRLLSKPLKGPDAGTPQMQSLTPNSHWRLGLNAVTHTDKNRGK